VDDIRIRGVGKAVKVEEANLPDATSDPEPVVVNQ